MNRHVFYLIVILGAILVSGIVAVIRPLRADPPQQGAGIYVTPRMAQSLQQ